MKIAFCVNLIVFLMFGILQAQECEGTLFEVKVDSILISRFPDLQYRIDEAKKVISNFESFKIDSSYVSLGLSFRSRESCIFHYDESAFKVTGKKHRFSSNEKTLSDISNVLENSELIIENEKNQFRVFSDGLRKEKHLELIGTDPENRIARIDCAVITASRMKEFRIEPILTVGLKVTDSDSKVRFHYIVKCNKKDCGKRANFVYTSDWIYLK